MRKTHTIHKHARARAQSPEAPDTGSFLFRLLSACATAPAWTLCLHADPKPQHLLVGQLCMWAVLLHMVRGAPGTVRVHFAQVLSRSQVSGHG